MARFVAAVLVLTLALAPAASAAPRGSGASPFAGWLDVFYGALDWLFGWAPTLRAETGASGAYIVVEGVDAEPPSSGARAGGSGLQAVTRGHGAMIIVNGVGVPGSPENPGARGRSSLQQNH